MRLRLALASTAVALAVVPLAGTSHASTCNTRDFPEVCALITRVCQSTLVTQKVCSLFA